MFRYNLIVSIAMMLIAAFSVGGVVWLILETQRERTVLADLSLAYDDAVQKSAYASTVRTLLRDTEAERAELDQLVKGRDPVEIIRVVEEIGNAAGIKISVNAVNPGGAHRLDPTLASFVLSLSAEGPFERLHHFVSLLAAFPAPSNLEVAKFEAIERQWRLNATLRVYTAETL